jgi:hypothetical protein
MTTTVAARTAFNSSKTGIVGSNPIRSMGRAIAQTVICWLPTAAAKVRSQVRSCGVMW